MGRALVMCSSFVVDVDCCDCCCCDVSSLVSVVCSGAPPRGALRGLDAADVFAPPPTGMSSFFSDSDSFPGVLFATPPDEEEDEDDDEEEEEVAVEGTGREDPGWGTDRYREAALVGVFEPDVESCELRLIVSWSVDWSSLIFSEMT